MPARVDTFLAVAGWLHSSVSLWRGQEILAWRPPTRGSEAARRPLGPGVVHEALGALCYRHVCVGSPTLRGGGGMAFVLCRVQALGHCTTPTWCILLGMGAPRTQRLGLVLGTDCPGASRASYVGFRRNVCVVGRGRLLLPCVSLAASEMSPVLKSQVRTGRSGSGLHR